MLQDTTFVPERSRPWRILQGVLNTVAAIGTIWIVAIMFLIVADVFGRNFLAMPIIGVAEIAARSVVAIVFLMLPAAALNGVLIRADFLQRGLRYLAPGSIMALEAVFALVGAAVFLLVAIAAWPDTARSLQSAEFFGVRGVWTLPTFPFRLIVVLGSFGTSLAFAVTALSCLVNMRRSKAS